jgi:tetratricopeptide (TPR) repeat protein
MDASSQNNLTEGFDLDALSADPTGNASADGSEVIYELGGGATLQSNPNPSPKPSSPSQDSKSNSNQEPDPLRQAEEFKQQGNKSFQAQHYLDAIDHYTSAIQACPNPESFSTDDLLNLKERHEEKEREKATRRYERDSNRRLAHRNNNNPRKDDKDSDQDDAQEDEDEDKEDASSLEPTPFHPPTHTHAKPLSIYHSNRAACLVHLEKYDDAIQDCDIALWLQPDYVKALIRRMGCYEKTDGTELALKDAKSALEICQRDDQNGNGNGNARMRREVREHVKRLEKEEEKRMEKLKEETMGKLKDLGNSILGNFGMSMDNFKAEKDPNTGSYSIRMV